MAKVPGKQFYVEFTAEDDDGNERSGCGEEVLLIDERRDCASPGERAVVAAAAKSEFTHLETTQLRTLDERPVVEIETDENLV